MCNSSLVVHRDRLLAFGGLVRSVTGETMRPLTPIGDVLEYTPNTDTWIQLSIMPKPSHSVCVTSLGERLSLKTVNSALSQPSSDHLV